MKKINELFSVHNELMKDFFDKYLYPVDILPNIHSEILSLGTLLSKDDYEEVKKNVWVHKSCEIGDNVEIVGPAIIMDNTTLRHNAYIRENVIIGRNVTIGNSCEIKNSIIMDDCQIPHFNYVGDSLLGNHVHLGAGVIIANLRLDKKNVRVEKEETSLRKIGAFIGDDTEIGCNSVIYPGTVLEKNSVIYPLSQVSNRQKEAIKRL